MEHVQKKSGNITVKVDYRTELLGIIMCISNYRNKFPSMFKPYENQFYVQNIIDKFGKYKEENVIKQFDDLVAHHGFAYDAPLGLFLQLDDHFKCKQLSDYIFYERLDGNPKIYEFIDQLDDFAHKIDFQNYYQSQIEMYQKFVNSICKQFDDDHVSEFLQSYYGYQSGNLFINLMPYMTNHAFHCKCNQDEYSCIPTYNISKKENLFDIEDQRVIIMSVHEFGHGYVNPLTEQYLKENDIPDLFSDIVDVIRKQAYGKISSIINEHVIRAIVIRYISLIYHDEAWVQRAIQNEKKRGFIYIEDILESLEEYENQRQNYPTFDLYYPMIVKHLETVKAR